MIEWLEGFLTFTGWLKHHHHRHHRWRIHMATDLGTLPITVTATADDLAGAADPAAVLSFELSGAVDASGNAIDDPTTVATLDDHGDGTCTVTEASGASEGASVNLDAVGVDPAGSPPVSSAASGDTLTFTVPTVTPPPPTSNISRVTLAITDNPNAPAAAAAAPEATAATEEPAAPAAAEEPAPEAAPAEVVTPGAPENQPPAVNDAGWPVS